MLQKNNQTYFRPDLPREFHRRPNVAERLLE